MPASIGSPIGPPDISPTSAPKPRSDVRSPSYGPAECDENRSGEALAEFTQQYKHAGEQLDSILIVASLILAVNGPFLVEAAKPLQPDHQETTTKLLRSLILVIHTNTTANVDELLHLEALPKDIRADQATIFFSISLCTALAIVCAAVVLKQWIKLHAGMIEKEQPSDLEQVTRSIWEGRATRVMDTCVKTLYSWLLLPLGAFFIGFNYYAPHISRGMEKVAIASISYFGIVYLIAFFLTLLEAYRSVVAARAGSQQLRSTRSSFNPT